MFIDILSVGDTSRVVTVIEVLSPSNKTAGSEGQQLYITKQQEILQSSTHLIEIDLLRHGDHTVAAPHQSLRQRGAWDYLVCLHRGGQRGRYEVWACSLRQRLPRIRVPLTNGDADVALDITGSVRPLLRRGSLRPSARLPPCTVDTAVRERPGLGSRRAA